MSGERRVHQDFQSGTVTDNPLLIGATAFNSAELAGLEEITSGEHACIVLDPLGQHAGPEIAYVTAHAAAATVATIARAKEGTTAVEHPSTTKWALSATAYDLVHYCTTSSDLPSSPFRGQMAFVLDTQRFLVWNGVAWKPPWNMPWGVLATNKSTGSGALGAFITSEAVILTTDAVDVPNGRRIKVTMRAAVSSPSADYIAIMQVRRGTTTGGTLVDKKTHHTQRASVAEGQEITTIDTPSANVALRYVLTAECFSAVAASGPWFWTVEDVGPAANPT